MNPTRELKSILQDASGKRKKGTVIKTTIDTVFVTVGSQTRAIKRTDATDYKPGDTVSVQGDALLGRRRIKPAKIFVV